MLRSTFNIGAVGGIPVRIHISWVLIFLLVTWNLAGVVFPQQYPGWLPGVYLGSALLTSLLFFSSVLLHELAHSFVAQGRGLPVRDITLFIFGGVSDLSEEPQTAATEFLMALVGPLTSLLLGSVFLLLSAVAGGTGQPLPAITRYLGGINISLGLFNLIPGFPLDGGRVLRSLLWRRTGNLTRATHTASLVGQAVAYLFILYGVWQIFAGQWGNGIWIAFIGWFLDNAAQASYRGLVIKNMLAGHTVREIMSQDCYTLPPTVRLEELVHEHLLATGRRCFPIVQDSQLMGLLTLHDIKKVPRTQWGEVTVQEVMTSTANLKTIEPDDGLSPAMQEMTEEGVNQLPVMEGGQLVGMLARDNVLSFIHVRAELGM
jgi:Zn-dependent protease/CBS domain-containing protein